MLFFFLFFLTSTFARFSQGLDDHALAFLTVKDKTDWIAIFTECKEAVGKVTHGHDRGY